MPLKQTLISLVIASIIPSIVIASELYVVVSNNLKAENFSSDDVKHILLGETSQIKNARVNLIYPSYSSPEIETLSKFVGKGGSVRNLKAYWSRMIFTGKGIPPLTANSEAELKQLINKENSIGVSTIATDLNVVYTIKD
jgi:hypothetical protein